MRAALITISTSKSAGNGKDESGDRLAALAEQLGLQLAGRDLIPDDQAQIEQRLRHWTDVERCELVLTSGGTRWQRVEIAAAFSSSNSKPGAAWPARTMKSRTDSASSDSPEGDCSASFGRERDGTRHVTSPGTRSGSRLVASTVRFGRG